MEKLFRVKLQDGTVKDFTDEKEANACEADVKLKQEKAEIDRKTEMTLLKEINEQYNKFINLVKTYEDAYSKSLVYYSDYSSGKNEIKPVEETSNKLWFYDDTVSELLKFIKRH